MKKKAMFVLVSLMLAFSVAGQALAGEEIKPGKKDRCPVCGMFVKPYPNWVAVVKFSDESLNFFDGPKDMFKFLFFMEKYNKKKTREDVAEIYVTEFYSTGLMPAGELYFVVGSDVMGPMGHELIPVKGEENAKTFLEDHHGERAIRFEDLKAEDIPKMKR